ncbi:hypothetical protein EMIT0196MI5_130137 [Pseudomonas sp. IT-196MI5]
MQKYFQITESVIFYEKNNGERYKLGARNQTEKAKSLASGRVKRLPKSSGMYFRM